MRTLRFVVFSTPPTEFSTGRHNLIVLTEKERRTTMRNFLEALALVWLMAREQTNPDDGEERDAARYLAMLGEGRKEAAA